MMCAHRATVLDGKGLRDDQAAELIEEAIALIKGKVGCKRTRDG